MPCPHRQYPKTPPPPSLLSALRSLFFGRNPTTYASKLGCRTKFIQVLYTCTSLYAYAAMLSSSLLHVPWICSDGLVGHGFLLSSIPLILVACSCCFYLAFITASSLAMFCRLVLPVCMYTPNRP